MSLENSVGAGLARDKVLGSEQSTGRALHSCVTLPMVRQPYGFLSLEDNMSSATVSSKSQITIPASVRSALKIGPGDRIDFIKTGDDRFEVVAATQDVSRLRGMVKARRAVSVEEMDSAIRARAGKA